MVTKDLLSKIQYFKKKDDLSKVILVDSHPTEAADLQTHVLKEYANIDSLLLSAIRAYILDTAYNGKYPDNLDKLNLVLYYSLSELPLRKKVDILKNVYEGLRKKPTIKALKELNIIRNEFAHTELRFLGAKYHLESDEGAKEILRVYETCDVASTLLLEDLENFKELNRYTTYQMKNTPGVVIESIVDDN